MKEIIIRLGAGTIIDGFSNVIIELKSTNITQWQDRSNLPPSPELQQLLHQWQVLYPAALQIQSEINQSPVFDTCTPTNVSIQDLVELNYNFRIAMNNWLNLGDFARIDRRLRTDLNVLDRILVIIVSEQSQVWQLPWHFWDVFTDYHQAVEVFSKPRFSDVRYIKPKPNGKVNILTLSGRDPRLNLDTSFLKTLSRSHSDSIETISAHDIATKLNQSERSWDIFIFNGHGNTINHNSYLDGVIYLDNDTPVEISRLRIEIQKAVDRGLQIMICNCCNGLGLAEQLSDLNIPYIIVMREIVPNQCAQDFLRELLTRYSHGDSFPLAFKQARASLKLSSGEFAHFADWLPILFHNPLSDRVTWQDLSTTLVSTLIPRQFVVACRYLTQPERRIWANVGLSLLLSLLALNFQSQPQIVAKENAIVDRLQSTLAEISSLPPSKVTIVNYDAISLPDTVADDSELKELIDRVEPQIKPIAWSIGFDIDDRTNIFDEHIFPGCPNESINNPNLNQCDRDLINSLLGKYQLPNSFTQNLRLNLDRSTGSNRLIDRVKLSEIFNENNPKTDIEIKQLFDRKIILVGHIDDRETFNSLTKSAIIIDRIIRANDRQQFLPLFIYRSNSEQFAWIFGWSILAAILTYRRNWKILLLATISSEVVIGSILLIIGQGLPIIVTPIAMILVGSLIRILISGANCRSITFN